MKLFWRPTHVSTGLVVLVAGLAIGGYLAVETFQVEKRLPNYKLKLKAARLTEKAFSAVKEARKERNIGIDRELDPAGSGLIGVTVSHITSKAGHLPAKQTTINPNWGAVFVAMYLKAGLRNGDVLAFGLSGSFPAMNIAALAAAKAMGLKPIIISSLSSSMWGANHSRFTWVDLESILREAEVLPVKSIAASYGGIEDRGIGIPKRGIRFISNAIERNEVPKLEGNSFKEMVSNRIKLYEDSAEGSPIQAYVNIGGGIASVGSLAAKKRFRSGINRGTPAEAGLSQDGVMGHFLKKDVPVINIVRIKRLSQRYGLPWVPVVIPNAGEGGVYRAKEYATWLVWSVLGIIGLALIAITRVDVNFLLRRFFVSKSKPTTQGPSV